jgi:hypothetical protein
VISSFQDSPLHSGARFICQSSVLATNHLYTSRPANLAAAATVLFTRIFRSFSSTAALSIGHVFLHARQLKYFRVQPWPGTPDVSAVGVALRSVTWKLKMLTLEEVPM